MNGRSARWPAWVLIGVLIAVQQTVSFDQGAQFGRTLGNMLHIPLFTAITLLLHRALPRLRLRWLVVTAVAIALVTEALQTLNARHASWHDVALNGVGIGLAAAGLHLSRMAVSKARLLGRPWLIWATVASLVAVVTLLPPLRVLLAYELRERQFPVIWERPAWASTILVAGNSTVRTVTAPDAWTARAGEQVLEIVWKDTAYPRVDWLDVVPDWSGHDRVIVEVFNPHPEALRLTAALGYRGQTAAPRLATAWVTSGPATLEFALSERARRGEPVTRFVLRAPRSEAGRSLLIGRVALERSRGIGELG